MQTAHITGIYIHPIKSCGIIPLESSPVTERGLPFDREWLVMNADGKLLTQRDSARMALVQPTISIFGELSLEAPGMPPLAVPTIAEGELQKVVVWGDELLAIDQGDAVSDWISEYLKQSCRLMRFDQSSQRKTKQLKPNGAAAPLAFTDSCPILIVSEETLTDLNERLPQPVPMSRFRPSIVVKGLGAYGEDQCQEIQLNGLTLHAAKPCARCVIVSIGQEDGVLHAPEPLQTLHKFRKLGEKVMFGYYFIPSGAGSVHVGDELRVSAPV